jgi:hypothetical protein
MLDSPLSINASTCVNGERPVCDAGAMRECRTVVGWAKKIVGGEAT